MTDKQTVVVAVFEHKHGTDVRVFLTEEAAYGWRTSIADEWWDAEFPGEERPDLENIGEAYFDGTMRGWGEAEYFTVQQAVVEGD